MARQDENYTLCRWTVIDMVPCASPTWSRGRRWAVPPNGESRLAFERLVALMEKATEDADAVLCYGSEIVETLGAYLKIECTTGTAR